MRFHFGGIMTLVRLPFAHRIILLLVCLVVGKADADTPKSFGEVYAEKGAPQEKEIFEAKRVIIWKYGSERVVFKDGIVVGIEKVEQNPSVAAFPAKSENLKREEEEAERRQERLRVTRERMTERRQITGIGPVEDLNERDVAGMLSAFAAAGEKEENKTPGAVPTPLGSEFAPAPIETIQ
jgi:hypothetical protein